jgi:hypothetical protein
MQDLGIPEDKGCEPAGVTGDFGSGLVPDALEIGGAVSHTHENNAVEALLSPLGMLYP